jgi:hypothetical protein
MRLKLLVLVLLLGGCAYGFTGGGLPPEIRTVAVLPFENLTADPTMAQQAHRSVREGIERRLGLRIAAEAVADAVVRGTIQRYEPDIPVAYRSTGNTGGQRGNDVEVNRRLLQIAIDIEFLERESGRRLLLVRNFRGEAQYATGQEAEGRRLALENLVANIISEAQKQF